MAESARVSHSWCCPADRHQARQEGPEMRTIDALKGSTKPLLTAKRKPPTIKVMTPEDKFARVQADLRSMRAFVLPFVKEHISEEAAADLKAAWHRVTRPVPREASPTEKYEIAYSNFISMASTSINFVRERLGEDGIAKYKRAEVESLKRANAGPALAFLALVRAVAPGLAFTIMARKMAYEFQWLTPFSVSELNGRRAVFPIERCKILDYPSSEDICQIGCQQIYPMWQAEQFRVDMKFKREDHSCTCTITPLR